ncbi:MAG: hypothetical protein O7C75_04290, partial [Verrucomicrobia bacterium]|nr:hypothetical protein [Verrucomicrobiota bacterium]
MIVRNPNTTESPLRKRNLLTVRYLVCSFLAGFCSLTKSVPVAALTITVEVEHGVTLDHRGNTIYLGDENYLFITPEGKIVFPGSILDYTDGNLILTSAKGAAPVILVTAPLSNDRVFDFEDFAFDGNRYVAYLDRNGNVSVVDVETGVEDQQGAFAYDVMAVTAFGEALYANREEDRIRRIMLDEIVVYTDGGVFEGFNVSRISSTKVTANAAADVFFILSGSSEETGSIALAVKNGIIVDTGSIEEIWPYLGSAYILFMSNGDVLINGTDQIDNGELWAEFTVVAENGDIYFMGNDGIYLYDADADVDAGEENLSLLINETDFGVSGTTPVGRTSRGDLVFVGNGGVFLYDTSNSEVISLLVEDDEVDGRPVDSIYWSYDSYELQGIGLSEDVVAIRGEIDGEPAIFRIELYPETGPVYTVSELCPEIPAGFAENQSFEESESIYPDPFTSSDPIDLREGPCGGNWHTRIWKETATGEELDFVPGAEGHTDNIVSVKETDLVISDGPIILESADLTGSLEISSPLTLSKDSNIQDLIQGSDMVINGILELSGANVWRNGSTEGTGSVRIQSASKLDIDLLQGSRFLGLEIQ